MAGTNIHCLNNNFRYTPPHWAWFSHKGNDIWETETTNNIVERFNQDLKVDGVDHSFLKCFQVLHQQIDFWRKEVQRLDAV